MLKTPFRLPTLAILPGTLLILLLFGAEAWAACPTGSIEMFRDGSARPDCISKSQLRSQQLRQRQTRQRLKNRSDQRALQNSQIQNAREQQRLTRPQQ